ncbi:MAG: glycosyltransferase family 39 protein [Hyphomicrobiales bacterium]
MIVAYVSLVAFVVYQRAYISYAETDFITFTIPDALRVLQGEPTQSLYHPPLYALAIAGGKSLFGDWLSAGLAVSFLTGLVSLLVCFALFRDLAGKVAGWGAVLALLGSTIFMEESFRAGNDMLFLCLFLLSCWLAVLALENRSGAAWFSCGMIVGLALLTRSNALPLLLLAGAPALDSKLLTGEKLKAGVKVVGGLAVPLIAIAVFAYFTGSRVLPANNLLNLSVTYFVEGSDRASFDAALAAAKSFEEHPALLLSDPLRVLRIYLWDFYEFLRIGLPRLVASPLLVLAIPAIFILFKERLHKPVVLFGIVVAAEILLTNFKSFDARYYLFLVPVLGAIIARTAQWIVLSNFPFRARAAFAATVAVLVVFALGSAAIRSAVHTINNDIEIAAVIDKFSAVIGPSSAILARKPHVPYYTNSDWVYLPDSQTLEQLKLNIAEPSGEVFEGLASVIKMSSLKETRFLYFGEYERKYRPQFASLTQPDQAPEWLDVVVTSDRPEEGTLYRLNESSGSSETSDPHTAPDCGPAC